MKILIVDDSSVMRKIVQRTLRQAGYAGHDIDEAEDGEDALEKISTDTPDLVLCDWNMPRMSGIELLEALKERGSVPSFAFVTSESTGEMRSRATEAGAAAFLTKPFTADSLQDAVGHILG